MVFLRGLGLALLVVAAVALAILPGALPATPQVDAQGSTVPIPPPGPPTRTPAATPPPTATPAATAPPTATPEPTTFATAIRPTPEPPTPTTAPTRPPPTPVPPANQPSDGQGRPWTGFLLLAGAVAATATGAYLWLTAADKAKGPR